MYCLNPLVQQLCLSQQLFLFLLHCFGEQLVLIDLFSYRCFSTRVILFCFGFFQQKSHAIVKFLVTTEPFRVALGIRGVAVVISEAVFTLGDVDFNFICLNGTFDVDVKI